MILFRPALLKPELIGLSQIKMIKLMQTHT